MGHKVFEGQTGNVVSGTYRVSGLLQVNVSGNLDGADVTTYYMGASGVKTPIKTCSWRTSKGDTLDDFADGGQQILQGDTDVWFELTNAGATTNINLDFYCDKM